MNILPKIEKTIGGTPLVLLAALTSKLNLQARILAKVEAFNPAGSVKDRTALFMLDAAEAKGRLKPGATVIEPTSGNTGIGLAFVGEARGYRVILTMPETMSEERRSLLLAYGAELVLTPGADGMRGAIARAKQLAAEIPGSFVPSQFDNPANPAAHEATTGPEIWRDAGGAVDIFVAGVGTGGTITGAGRYLKKQNPALQVVAVEPAASAVLSGKKPGAHKIQGIGAGFVPGALDRCVLDAVMPVEDDAAFASTRLLAKTESIMAGISSGAALWAAIELAKKEENKDKNIVVVLPDSGNRYLSTGVFG